MPMTTMSNVVPQSEEVTNLLVSPPQTSGSDDGGLFNPAGLAKLEKVVEVLVIRTIHRVLEPTMADLVQRVVRKELDEAQLKLLSSCFKGNPQNETQTSNNPRCLKLKFQQSVSDPVFTGKEIEAKGGFVLQLALIDDVTGDVVETGRESSAEIEIVALQDDDADEDNQEFDKYIKRVNNANKSLLVGKLRLKLNKGIGNLHNVKFSHCSAWMKNSEYKLGARVVGTFSGVVIKEAKTESFTLKDQRSEYNKKHDPPCLSDDVWRLKNISKEGKTYDRLKKQRVETVDDFLVPLLRDSKQLKEIRGQNHKILHIAPKLWEETVNHARRCRIDNRVYWYTDSQNTTGVVFDLFGQVLGLVVQSQYRRIQNLSMDEKANALKLKESGCSSHWEDIIKFSDEASFVQHLSNMQANSGQDFGSTSLANAEVCDAPIYSPSHNDFMSWMEGILNNDSSNIMFGDAISMLMPTQDDGSFPKVHALKHWRMVSLTVHALKFKRKRAETFDHVPKRHKSFQ